MDSLRPDGPRPDSAGPEDALPYITAPRGERDVELAGLDVAVTVSGLFVEVTQTLRFHNPNPRDLEGELVFPLPDGAAVCGYALDVEGEMVDGVVVPREEARRILEAEERKGVDPGLVEQVRGNVYRTRIYPIPAHGTRKVRVTWVGDLVLSGNEAACHVPLRHAAAVERVALRVEVVQAPVDPVVEGGVGNLSLARWENRWVAEAVLDSGAAAEDLSIRLPDLPPAFTAVERTADGELFFCHSMRPAPPESAARPWIPARIALAWDASGSRTDVSRELALLETLLCDWPQVVVDLQVFHQRVESEIRTFAIGEGGPRALLEYLRALPRDGGTCLSQLDFADLPHAGDEAWLLFTDGMDSLGQGLPRPAPIPVIAVNGCANCNSAWLEQLARGSDGLYVNLLRTAPAAASRRIRRRRFLPRAEGSRGCRDLHVTTGVERLTVTGRLTADTAAVVLHGEGGEVVRLEIAAGDAAQGRIVARAWAGRQARVIALVSPRDIAGLVALGRRYGLVTEGTSLLVLESLEQHLEYDLEPAASRPEMRAAFRERRNAAERDGARRERQRLDQVLALWEARVAWWETAFPRQLPRRSAPLREPVPGDREDMDLLSVSLGESTTNLESLAMDADLPPEMAMAAGGMDELADLDPGEEGGAPAARAAIHIRPWSPDAPYLDRLRGAGPDGAYGAYLEQRREFEDSPAFFLDCGDWFLAEGRRRLGLRVLSNIPETGLDDPALLRANAWRLQQAGETDAAVAIFEGVRARREDEPQSHRDLALALSDRWESQGRLEDAVRAMELLYHVVLGAWDRFPEIELIALMELNRLIHRAQAVGVTIPEGIDPRLRRNLDLDVRISMSWDADLTDVDLHVFEPTGEHAYYGHNRTAIGGLVSRDFTQGYGPEEYVLRRAVPGTYVVKAHYYGSSQQRITGACTVIVNVFTDFGRPGEKRQVLTLRLDRPSDQVRVGEVVIQGGAGAGHGDGRPENREDRFRKLARGMTAEELVSLVGQPVEVRGTDETILVYRPRPGLGFHLHLAPRLVAVRRVMDGAVLDLPLD